jgi:MFS transporter, DHA2 family, multidrug resistance protein
MPETTSVRRPRSRWWALAALSLSLLVVGLDTYVLNTALPTLSVKLGASTSQLQWITDAYTLAMAGVLLPAGQLGDRLGRRAMLLAGLALFGIASVITSQVHTVDELIGMRAVMGAGAAVILPLSISVLPGLFPGDAERRRAVAVTAMCTMLGMPAGPLLAGWMLTHFAWGSVFLINGPVAALSLAGVALLVPESKAGPGRAAAHLDWAGALLSAAGLIAVVYGIISEPVHGWDPSVLTALAGGAVLLAAFTAWQLRAASPLVDLRLFASRGFTWGSVAFALVSFAMAGVLFVLTPYLQIVQGADAQATGLRLLPMIAAMLVSTVVIGKSSGRVGPRVVIAAGMLLSAAGLVMLWRAPAAGGYGWPAAALAVFGAGLGLSLPTSTSAVLAVLPTSHAGAGTALNRALQRIAVCLAPAILGSILNDAYRVRLTGLPPGFRATATASVAGAHAVARRLPAAARRALVSAANHAYLHGMVEVALISAVVLAAGALLVLLFLPGRDPKVPGSRVLADTAQIAHSSARRGALSSMARYAQLPWQ